MKFGLTLSLVTSLLSTFVAAQSSNSSIAVGTPIFNNGTSSTAGGAGVGAGQTSTVSVVTSILPSNVIINVNVVVIIGPAGIATTLTQTSTVGYAAYAGTPSAGGLLTTVINGQTTTLSIVSVIDCPCAPTGAIAGAQGTSPANAAAGPSIAAAAPASTAAAAAAGTPSQAAANALPAASSSASMLHVSSALALVFGLVAAIC